MAYLVLLGRLRGTARPSLPLTHQQRLLAASGVNAALVLLAFLIRPDGTGWRFGAFARDCSPLSSRWPRWSSRRSGPAGPAPDAPRDRRARRLRRSRPASRWPRAAAAGPHVHARRASCSARAAQQQWPRRPQPRRRSRVRAHTRGHHRADARPARGTARRVGGRAHLLLQHPSSAARTPGRVSSRSVVERSAYEAAKTIADSEANAAFCTWPRSVASAMRALPPRVFHRRPSYDVNVAKGGAAAEIQVDSVMPVNEQHAERLVALAVARL